MGGWVQGGGGGLLVSSWRWSCIWHAGICRIPVGGDKPICVKSLFLRFLKAPITSKLKQRRLMNMWFFRCCQALVACGPYLVGVASTPLKSALMVRKGQNSCIQVNFSLSRHYKSFLMHISTLLDVLTIVDHVKADLKSLTRPPLIKSIVRLNRDMGFKDTRSPWREGASNPACFAYTNRSI